MSRKYIPSNVISVVGNRTTPKFLRIDCDCRPTRCDNIVDMYAIGFHCIWLGCIRLDSIVFHLGFTPLLLPFFDEGSFDLSPCNLQMRNPTSLRCQRAIAN